MRITPRPAGYVTILHGISEKSGQRNIDVATGKISFNLRPMYSVLAFLLTTIEMSAVIGGYALQSQLVFYNMLVYGSPFYLIQNAFTSGSLIHEKNPIYWGFMLFHVIKYFVIFRAQFIEDSNILRTFALIFEALYIGLSSYYLL
jgi:hypothetical protein